MQKSISTAVKTKSSSLSDENESSTATTAPSSQQSQSQQQPPKAKKQASLANFFTGVKPVAITENSKNSSQVTKAPAIKLNAEFGEGVWPNKEIIRIACWNVNGLRAVLKRGDIQKYLKNGDPDIICLNETKIDELNFIKEKVYEEVSSDYTHYWYDKRYSYFPFFNSLFFDYFFEF